MISCSHCHRQHKLRHLQPGESFRCVCGETTVVPAIARDVVPTLECALCGGPVDETKEQCGYCGVLFDISPQELALRCPCCLERMPERAKFCGACGARIEAQRVWTLESEVRCPRCKDLMEARPLHSTTVIECLACHGMWVSPKCFERLCVWAEGRSAATRYLFEKPAPIVRVNDEVKYLPCLICDDFMIRKNYAMKSGIIIDVCRNHGVWLDNGEARRVIEFIEKHGLAHPANR